LTETIRTTTTTTTTNTLSSKLFRDLIQKPQGGPMPGSSASRSSGIPTTSASKLFKKNKCQAGNDDDDDDDKQLSSSPKKAIHHDRLSTTSLSQQTTSSPSEMIPFSLPLKQNQSEQVGHLLSDARVCVCVSFEKITKKGCGSTSGSFKRRSRLCRKDERGLVND